MLLSINSKLRKDVVTTFVSQLFVMLVAFLLNKIFSNLLSVEEFGQYNVIRRSTAVLSFVMLGGIGITLPRYLPKFIALNHHKKLRGFLLASSTYIFINSTLTIVLCLILQPFFGEALFGSSSFSLLLILLVYSLFNAITNYWSGYFRGTHRFQLYNLTSIVGSLIMLMPIVLWSNLSVTSIFFIWAIGYMLVSVMIGLIELHKERYLSLRLPIEYTREQIKEVYKYSLPRLLGDAFLFLYSAFPVIFIGYRLGMAQAAYFSVGIAMLTMITPLYSFLGTILLPYVSKSIAEKNFKTADNLILKLFFIFLGTSSVIVVGFSLFMPLVIRLLFSSEYLSVVTIARIIMWGLIPQVLYLLYRNPIDACSIFPYNTITIGLCTIGLIIGFYFCHSLNAFAYCFLSISIFKGVLSLLSWIYVRNTTIHV